MIELLITFIFVLITIAFFTITERKVMASIQRRMGPNVVGFGGALQAFADGFKLIFKEAIIPAKANRVLFILSPILIIATGLVVWAFIPLSNLNYLVSLDFSLLVIYSVLSLGVYGVIMAGWSSNSRYAFIGSMRSASQPLSYEIFMALTQVKVLVIDAFEFLKAQRVEGGYYSKGFVLAYIVFAPTPEFDWWCAARDPIVEFDPFNNKNLDLGIFGALFKIYFDLLGKGWIDPVRKAFPKEGESREEDAIYGRDYYFGKVPLEDIIQTDRCVRVIYGTLLIIFTILYAYVIYTIWLWFSGLIDLLKKFPGLRKPPYV